MVSSHKFKIGSWVVYPPHGVGRLESIEEFSIDEEKAEFFVISVSKSKLVLRLPVQKAEQAGLRHLMSKADMQNVLDVLLQKTRKKRTMWSKRSQEYEVKINSGDPYAIAGVIRDLHKDGAHNTTQSFSERQIYQLAMERLVRELSIVEKVAEDEIRKKLETLLQAA
ncbi:MAG: CarD family transcriptional regulator [Holosporales bacterium]|jgi:CarD family transcriptional regulator|nr:CarD family transcriptional regulator [Holosporales bacterium]